MSAIQELFQQAQLSEAAYANFIDPQIGNVFIDPVDIKSALIASGFSRDPNDPTQSAQATAFLRNWRIVSQFSESGVLSNGFSAALFERLDANQQPTGRYTFAIRGSTSLVDFLGADLDLAVTGVAKNQLVSMVNYVLRLRAGANGLAQQLTPLGTGLTSNLVSGVGPGIDPTQLTISGHSLGGYLGQVYQRIFGSAGVYTYNSLGLTDPNAALFNQVIDLLGLPPGSFSSGPGENVLVPGEPAQLIGTVQGKLQIQVFSETQSTTIDPISTIPAHKVGPLTDSLALYDLFAKLDPALNTTDPVVGIGKITDILKAASNTPALSLEAALDSLRKLFKDPAVPNLTATATDDREQYYQNLFNLQSGITPYAGTLTIDSLATISAADLASISQGSTAYAYRYALKELNPFAVIDVSGTLYARFLPGGANAGELDLYDPASRTGTLTADWITDRAAFLAWKNQYFTTDGVALRSTRDENYLFENRDGTGKPDLSLTVVGNLAAGGNGGAAANPAKVVFGGAAPDVLTGGILADRLYGDVGTDWLEGRANSDYLEGGKGLDIYNYNAFSGLLGTGNDGADTILDTDGKGVIRHTKAFQRIIGGRMKNKLLLSRGHREVRV